MILSSASYSRIQ